MHIGCHLSPSNGYLAMGRDALSIGADTFQFFTRNPRGSRAKAIDPADAAALDALQREHGFAPTVAHAPYTLNPCSADARVREFAQMTMADDLARLSVLPCGLYNLHPGSHTGQGAATGMRLSGTLLRQALSASATTDVALLVETMAGQGSEIGSTFEQIAAILDAAGSAYASIRATSLPPDTISQTIWTACSPGLTGSWASAACAPSISTTACNRSAAAATGTPASARGTSALRRCWP